MFPWDFSKTTIGEDYLRTGQIYPIDDLLDYLSGLKKMKEDNKDNANWQDKYNKEIEAVKEILRRQTSDSSNG